MLRIVAALSETGSAGMEAMEVVVRAGAGWTLLGETEAEGAFTSGWVCCILIVALGIAGLPPSGGRVMRAVSFLGAAAFWVTGSGGGLRPLPAGATGLATEVGAGAGLSGTVGRAPSDGGFGGGVIPLTGLTGPAPRPLGGFGGGGRKGLEPGVGGGAIWVVASSEGAIFVVSFLGPAPGGAVTAGLPGRLIRTVSRLAVGCSGLAGSVMRMVSAFEASSAVSDGAGGISSDIKILSAILHLIAYFRCQ